MGCDEIASGMEVAPSESKSKGVRVRVRACRLHCSNSRQIKLKGFVYFPERERLLEEYHENRLRSLLSKTTKPLPIGIYINFLFECVSFNPSLLCMSILLFMLYDSLVVNGM